MNKYVIEFSKSGYLKFTSHLDMLRLFKRSFKKTGVSLAYSQGFNPHPKMGFAQPLSLGYTSKGELLEFETREPYDTVDIKRRISGVMPEGIEIKECVEADITVKSLAAAVKSSWYRVVFPVRADSVDFEKILKDYLECKEILAEKRQKRTKKMVTVDIRSKIRQIDLENEEMLTLNMCLDSGSTSNLSPEQVITSFIRFARLDINRYDVEVERTKIIY